jgi:hypothetical protein
VMKAIAKRRVLRIPRSYVGVGCLELRLAN